MRGCFNVLVGLVDFSSIGSCCSFFVLLFLSEGKDASMGLIFRLWHIESPFVSNGFLESGADSLTRVI